MTAVLVGTQTHEQQIATAIRKSLTPDLLSPRYRHNPQAHCYVASEAFFHATGGYKGKWRPKRQPTSEGQHWWLEDGNGGIVDLTADQFPNPVDYTNGRGCGFLTRNPSRRARVLLDRITDPNGGLAAGEQPGSGSQPEQVGATSPETRGGGTAPVTSSASRPAPAASPAFKPDPKKGK